MLSATRNLHSQVTVSGKRGIRHGETETVIRCHNQSELHQRNMRHNSINPGLVLGPQGGSRSSPRAGIALRPELARSSWIDTMMGRSLRQTGRDRQGEQHREVCFWLVLSSGFPPAGASSRMPDTQWSHLRRVPVGLAL
jgi:hypothetical protein